MDFSDENEDIESNIMKDKQSFQNKRIINDKESYNDKKIHNERESHK